MFSNKKAVSELISFILITLIVAIISSVAYLFANNLLETNAQELDEDKMESVLRQFAKHSSEVQAFDGTVSSITFSFNSGLVYFNGDAIIYRSLARATDSETTCFTICYTSNEGYSTLYYNLTNNFTFDKNLTLSPGEYIVTITNNKNASELILSFR